MTTHPRTEELVAAVAGWIEELRPTLDQRDAFLARVAVNALGIVGRELTIGAQVDAAAARRLGALLGRSGSVEGLEAALCAAIRAGEVSVDTPGLLDALRANTADRLAVDQPSYPPEGGHPGLTWGSDDSEEPTGPERTGRRG
jgi:hypothetical protein